jgi:hypothetical protein
MLMKSTELSLFSPATRPSVSRKLKCDAHTVYIFDKGYNDYKAFEHYRAKTGFVTRIKRNAKYEVTQKNLILETIHSGFIG